MTQLMDTSFPFSHPFPLSHSAVTTPQSAVTVPQLHSLAQPVDVIPQSYSSLPFLDLSSFSYMDL